MRSSEETWLQETGHRDPVIRRRKAGLHCRNILFPALTSTHKTQTAEQRQAHGGRPSLPFHSSYVCESPKPTTLRERGPREPGWPIGRCTWRSASGHLDPVCPDQRQRPDAHGGDRDETQDEGAGPHVVLTSTPHLGLPEWPEQRTTDWLAYTTAII